MRTIRTSAASLLLLAAFSGATFAAEGRIPIFQPTTITESGRYVVTRAISVVASGYVSALGPSA